MLPVYFLPLSIQLAQPNFQIPMFTEIARTTILRSDRPNHFYFDFSETDKILHFTVSTAEVIGVTFVARKVFKWNKPLSILSAILVTTATGLVKEYLVDQNADHHDLVANGAGTFTGAAISFAVF